MSYDYRVRILVEERRSRGERDGRTRWSRFTKLFDTRTYPAMTIDEADELYSRLAVDLRMMEERRSS